VRKHNKIHILGAPHYKAHFRFLRKLKDFKCALWSEKYSTLVLASSFKFLTVLQVATAVWVGMKIVWKLPNNGENSSSFSVTLLLKLESQSILKFFEKSFVLIVKNSSNILEHTVPLLAIDWQLLLYLLIPVELFHSSLYAVISNNNACLCYCFQLKKISG